MITALTAVPKVWPNSDDNSNFQGVRLIADLSDGRQFTVPVLWTTEEVTMKSGEEVSDLMKSLFANALAALTDMSSNLTERPR